jgi:hypothetical protein
VKVEVGDPEWWENEDDERSQQVGCDVKIERVDKD